MLYQGLYLMPIISIAFTMQFPSALNLYWCTNNFISLGQSSLLRQPSVRDYFGIEETVKWKPEDLPMTNFYVSKTN